MQRLVWIVVIVATVAGATCLGVSAYNSVVRYACAIKAMKEAK